MNSNFTSRYVLPSLLIQGILNSPDDISRVKAMEPHLQHARSQAEGWYLDTAFISKFHAAAMGVTKPENFTLMLRMLMDAGMPIDIQNSEGETALHGANNLAIPCLVKMGAELNAKDHSGNTPLNLHCAQSLSGLGEIQWEQRKGLPIEVLVNWPAALEEPNHVGMTPLLSACLSRESNSKLKLKTLKFLIENGANINAVDHKRNSIVDIWLDKSGDFADLETFMMLKSKGASISPTQLQKVAIKAVMMDDAAFLEEVLQTGLTRAGAHDGPSDALHFACVADSPASCAKLLEWGWDPFLPVNEIKNTEQRVHGNKKSAYDAAFSSQYETNHCLGLIQAWLAQKNARLAIEAISEMNALNETSEKPENSFAGQDQADQMNLCQTPRKRSAP